jgi:hypothetical protein
VKIDGGIADMSVGGDRQFPIDADESNLHGVSASGGVTRL